MNFDAANPAFIELVSIECSINIVSDLGRQEESRGAKEYHQYEQGDGDPSQPAMPLFRRWRTSGTIRPLRRWFGMVVLFHAAFDRALTDPFSCQFMLGTSKTQWGERPKDWNGAGD